MQKCILLLVLVHELNWRSKWSSYLETQVYKIGFGKKQFFEKKFLQKKKKKMNAH